MIHILIPYTKDRRERLKETIASIQEHTHNVPYCIVAYENEYIGWANAVRNMVDEMHPTNVVMLLESDVTVEAGWLKVLYQQYLDIDSRDAIVEPYNEFHGGNLIQHPMCRAGILQECINRDYFHQYADNEMSDMMKKFYKYRYVPEAKISHNHVRNGKAEDDKSYAVVFNNEMVEKDRQLYDERKHLFQ